MSRGDANYPRRRKNYICEEYKYEFTSFLWKVPVGIYKNKTIVSLNVNIYKIK